MTMVNTEVDDVLPMSITMYQMLVAEIDYEELLDY